MYAGTVPVRQKPSRKERKAKDFKPMRKGEDVFDDDYDDDRDYARQDARVELEKRKEEEVEER
jgi:phosphopantothenoylcysteine synthetase/decarboxylase